MEYSSRSWLPLWIFISGAAVYFLVRKLRSSGVCRLPPGPRRLPIIGNMFDLGKNPNQCLARLAKTYGPVMTLRLGWVNTVVISSQAMAREALQKHDAVLAYRSIPDSNRAMEHATHSMVWIPPEQQWRMLRKITNAHLFSPRSLDANEDVRCRKTQETMQWVADCAAEGLPVHVGQLAFTISLNLLSRTLFSKDFSDLSSDKSSGEFMDVVKRIMFEIGRPNISDYFPPLASIDPQRSRRNMTELREKLHRIFEDQIQQRTNGGENHGEPDFLDALLRYRDEEDNSKSARLTIKSLLSDIFVAGTDTSSSTVEWAMAELIRSPPAMSKVREEIGKVVGFEREMRETDINDLPYLQAVVKETLRLHPPTPFLIPRRASTAVELNGYQVPEGTRVIVNAWAIGRDADVWKSPEQFSPERFMGNEVDYRGRHFELIPFGAGRRICPGLPLAFRVVHLIIASLVQRFEWGLPEGMTPAEMDMSEKFGITLCKAAPLKLVATPIIAG